MSNARRTDDETWPQRVKRLEGELDLNGLVLQRIQDERDWALERVKILEEAGGQVALRLSMWSLPGGRWLCQGDKDAWDAWSQAMEGKP